MIRGVRQAIAVLRRHHPHRRHVRHSRQGRRDDGRAIVEFLAVGLLVLVPVVYLVVTLARVQAAAFAASTASREAGRAFTTAPTEASAYARAQAAADLTFEDFDVSTTGTVVVRCDGSPCLRPEGQVESVATVTVRLPLVPDFLSGAMPTVVPVSATHVATVDRFRGR
ncbi:MAG: pilus assembly protein [Lapillicoccus sp.]